MPLEIRPLREEDRDRFVSLTAQCFNVPPDRRTGHRTLPAESVRVAWDRGTVVASLVIHRWGQHFGGRSVPAAGIGAVSVAPEARGRRVAETLVLETLAGLRAEGIAISSLYPATVPLYRRCGYEYAIHRFGYAAPLRTLVTGGAADCEPWEDSSLEEVAALYTSVATEHNGSVDRPRSWWEARILAPDGEQEVFRYLVREDDAVTGSIVFHQQATAESRFGYDLNCRDLTWTTPGAARALLALLGRHRSLGRTVFWNGPPSDPLALFIAEQDARPQWSFHIMTRLVDLARAIEARGYPEPVEGSLTIAVEDGGIAGNAGTWRIAVAGGKGSAEPLGRGAPAQARADVGALAAIWTGFSSPGALRRAGRLEAGDAAIATLEAIFTGPAPWLADFF